MTSVELVISEAKKLVTPSETLINKVRRISEEMVNRVSEIARKYSEVKGVVLGGSVAKGTWLPEDVDIDIFVLISKDVNESVFERIGLSIGNEAGLGYQTGKKYAQHPYVEILMGDSRINIVPCFDVGIGEWKSAADRSVYHLKLINERLDEEKKQEVRLLKKFMRVVGVYGAEIEKEGFSGYFAETLILNHGSFLRVLDFFANSKWEKQFSVIDPVDDKRDLARAVSKEKLSIMILACRSFLKEPSIDYFKELKMKENKSLYKGLYSLIFKHKEESEDILWGELKRTGNKLVSRLKENQFLIAKHSVCSNGKINAILLLPLQDKIPKYKIKIGPPVIMKESTERFIEANKGKASLIFVDEQGRICSIKKSEFSSLKEILEYLTKEGVGTSGFSKRMMDSIVKTSFVLSGRELLQYAKNKKWLKDEIKKMTCDVVGTD